MGRVRAEVIVHSNREKTPLDCKNLGIQKHGVQRSVYANKTLYKPSNLEINSKIN